MIVKQQTLGILRTRNYRLHLLSFNEDRWVSRQVGERKQERGTTYKRPKLKVGLS